MPKTYPAAVSRSMDPSGLGLTTVLGLHDKRLSDADINLLQDLQDYKRQQLYAHQAPSGALSLSPFAFNDYIEQTFYIPAFDVSFRGDVIRIGGSRSGDLTQNKISLPPPVRWAPGNLGDDAAVYVVTLELFYKALNPDTGDGYFVDLSGNRFFYPGGNVSADPSSLTLYPDNVTDPFNSIRTTMRVQLQWRLRADRVPLAYDFTANRYGLDPDPIAASQIFGRGGIPDTTGVSEFPFQSLSGITGEPALWRAGDGNGINDLLTVDGYTYAMPVAVVFQRNSGVYSVDLNPFGSASAQIAQSGLFHFGISGRTDGKYADIIYPEDVVDTRLSTSLTGYDPAPMADQGLSDLMTGSLSTKVARGEAPGAKTTLVGSKLSYTVSMFNRQMTHADNIGSFDSFMNGFSADPRVFYTTQAFSTGDKSTGVPNSPWALNDGITIQLGSSVAQGAAMVFVFVQSFSTNADGSKTPITLYGGQLQVTGLNTRQVNISFIENLTALPISPGSNPLIVTLGVQYPAGTGSDLRKVPTAIEGGEFYDFDSGATLPVFGVSEYAPNAALTPRTLTVAGLLAYNPRYSTLQFGTRVLLKVSALSAVISVSPSGSTSNAFTLARTNLDGQFTGLYVVSATDQNGAPLTISQRQIVGTNMTVVVDGTLDPLSQITFTVLCHQTCQASINPAVKGVTAIEEVIEIGSVSDNDLSADGRVTLASVSYDATNVISTVQAYAIGGQINGFAGDDVLPLIWLKGTSGTYTAYPCTVQVFGGIATIVAPGINLVGATWFLVTSFLPTPSLGSRFILSMLYQPYQGEGVLNRDYSVLYATDEATVTTNGTGSAPVVGIQDVYPFSREFPVVPTLPALPSWSDADLKNQALSGQDQDNFTAKQFNNTQATYRVPLFTNDFIEPIFGSKRRKIRMVQGAGNRGFSRALPHVGFAVAAPTTRSVLGSSLQTTVAPVTLYVNNAVGADTNDGLSTTNPKLTIKGALNALPPVIRHPVSIILVDTGVPYTAANLQQASFTTALFGDGQTRSSVYYCMGSLAFVMQESARITLGRLGITGERIVIDATGFPGFGDGPTFAFLVSTSRVIFNGIDFRGFTDAAIKVIDSDMELYDCRLDGNILGVSAEQGSAVTINGGEIDLITGATGLIASDSTVLIQNPILTVGAGANPNGFFIGERNSNITLQNHSVAVNPTLETNIVGTTEVASAQTGSSITCLPSWVSNGKATLETNSTLVRSVAQSPFLGGISADASSTVVANL